MGGILCTFLPSTIIQFMMNQRSQSEETFNTIGSAPYLQEVQLLHNLMPELSFIIYML